MDALADLPAGSRHSRRLTLRAAAALVDRLEKAALSPPSSAGSGGGLGGGGGGAPGLASHSGGLPVSNKSAISIVKGLIAKTVELKRANAGACQRALGRAAPAERPPALAPAHAQV
jgi:hypothetical protein